MAGGEGLEPSPTGPEPGVLPLDDPPVRKNYYTNEAGPSQYLFTNNFRFARQF